MFRQITSSLKNYRKNSAKKVAQTLAGLNKMRTFALAIAEIAQLVEHNLAKVRVASSSLVFRSQYEFTT